jgi:hypothetical protein
VLPLDRARFLRNALDSTVAYMGVCHAPPEATRTSRLKDSSILLRTSLRGPITHVEQQLFVVEHCGFGARVRHLLPDALDLGVLVNQEVSIELTERFHDGRCTVDARLFRENGRLILWARDGDLPEDRASYGLAMHVQMADDRPTLAISHGMGLCVMRDPGFAMVTIAQGPLLVMTLRTGHRDAAFIALGR